MWSPTQGHAAGEVCTSLGSRQAGSGVPARDPLPRGLTVTRVSLTLTLRIREAFKKKFSFQQPKKARCREPEGGFPAGHRVNRRVLWAGSSPVTSERAGYSSASVQHGTVYKVLCLRLMQPWALVIWTRDPRLRRARGLVRGPTLVRGGPGATAWDSPRLPCSLCPVVPAHWGAITWKGQAVAQVAPPLEGTPVTPVAGRPGAMTGIPTAAAQR